MKLTKIKLGGRGIAALLAVLCPILSAIFYHAGFWAWIAAGYAFIIFLNTISFKITNQTLN